jgi:hypothetical protein
VRSANTTTSRSSGLHPLLVVHLSIETRTLAPPLLEIDSIRERADQKKPMSRLRAARGAEPPQRRRAQAGAHRAVCCLPALPRSSRAPAA